jgi:hypothetical protein
MSLIELMVALGLMTIIFGGAFLSYSSILDTLTNSELRGAAVAVLNREIEIIRNLAYDDIGVISGIPVGILSRQKTVPWKNVDFLVITTVRNIDDPFDGVLGGTPNDTAPADYKMVEVEVSCLQCKHFVPIALTTSVAPKNLESMGQSGSLFIHTLSAYGVPVSGATVRVVNAAITPTIDLTDMTNNDGVLQLVGVPTTTDSYQIWVTKPGYSSEQTYPLGGALNPNPIHPHQTVEVGALTDITFYTDALTTTTIATTRATCEPVPNVPFTLTGSRLIGIPDVIKNATTSQTGPDGAILFPGFEWDAYNISYTVPGLNLFAAVPGIPFSIDPGTSSTIRLVFADPAPNALSFTVRAAGTGVPVPGAYITLSKGETHYTGVTGRSSIEQTTWVDGAYSSESGGIDTTSVPGSFSLVAPYPTSTEHWLISNTFDTGSASTTYFTLSWTPTAQPPAAGTDSLRFQVAANNDTATWNFVGPDGTSATYFTTSGAALPYGLSGNRYIRYRAILRTSDETTTPSVSWIGIEYTGACVPSGSFYFGGLANDTYDVLVTGIGFADATTTVTTSAPWQELTVELAQ